MSLHQKIQYYLMNFISVHMALRKNIAMFVYTFNMSGSTRFGCKKLPGKFRMAHQIGRKFNAL